MAEFPKRGIDISEFNGNVDIAALKGQVESQRAQAPLRRVAGCGGQLPAQRRGAD